MKWYKCSLCEVNESEYEKYFSMMSPAKKARIDRCRLDDKKRSIAGEMLARRAISECCDIEEEQIAFKEAENGKPYAENLNIHFNISHSDDVVICAVSDEPVGVDIEKIREIDLKVAHRVFNSKECDYVFEDKDKTYERFFEIWTRREAYAKLSGDGISKISDNIPDDIVELNPVISGYAVSIIKRKS